MQILRSRPIARHEHKPRRLQPLSLPHSKRWSRYVGVDLVEDEDLDIGLGLLLIPEAIELG